MILQPLNRKYQEVARGHLAKEIGLKTKNLGISAIPATPFDAQRKIDFETLKSLIEFKLKAQLHGITMLEILGEVLRPSEGERRQVTQTVVDQVNYRVILSNVLDQLEHA